MHKLGGTAIVLSWNLTAWLVMVLVFAVHCVYVVQIVVPWSVGLWVSNLQNVESRSNDLKVTCCRRLIALDVFFPSVFLMT